MKHDKSLWLIGVQLVLMLCLFMLEITDQPDGWWRWALCVALFITTAFLLQMRLEYVAKLKEVVAALQRARTGNLNTRLLAKDDPLLDEVMFSVNELIEQLSKVQVHAIKSEAARKSLLSNISHDIRTPLTTIIGYVDALKDGIAVSTVEREQYLDIILKKASFLKQLLDEIFHLAKLDADEVPLQLQLLDVAELVREALIPFLPELQKARMELKVSIPEQRCMLKVDRLSLLRILNNLIKNAVQYGQQGHQLGVELVESRDEYQIHIWDQGAGISSADVPYIFERMYRADRSRNLTHGGSGLGLAITKALVEQHAGRIWVESEPDRRTTFSFTIPKRGTE
ncbi:sensor histidine kinase [Paenibacillus sp. 481]|uniref:sensor histidine kinase n=1 Tax=Paenibacillus sp. 481 TaxID=2835869 RepID=UPI001E416464|nr:HAMP domain-containing sensor histidine kinase [Paenibacillus sp. 481]UHA71764.1 HAMP domain-containing histidine kinase [Paenibacillus sp. 481]